MIQPNVASSATAMTRVSSHDVRISLLSDQTRLPCFLQALRLELQPRRNAPGNLAQHELVDRLAHARADAVLGRRDVHVMAAIVLDAEVAIADEAVHDLRGDAIGAARLVAELVPDQERARCWRSPQPSVSARNDHHGSECVPMNQATTKNCTNSSTIAT